MTHGEPHDHDHYHDHHHDGHDDHGHHHEHPAPRLHGGPHEHVFLGASHDRNARRTWLVIALTATMMVVEIVAGTIYGSMALVADGWHMSTHAAAMLIAAVAYLVARRQATNPRFTFGTGKISDLAAFASANVLALVALLIGAESVARFFAPVNIDFSQAIAVAVVGLIVNLVSAWLLRDDHHHEHGHVHGGDNNLRAAYLHVLADALTSVLAIAALLAGSLAGWTWMDPAMGIVGALVIARWSWSLIRDAGRVLVDYVPDGENLPQQIRHAIEDGGDARITDLHVWQVGPGHKAAIVALEARSPQPAETYRAKLADITGLAHLTVEVSRA
ncbi:CDF family Co(II)/Ni(II) efflux transporter DmeF [Paradevosia shaoguanensis]|uniref:CDF family Co(II)/Ni(II) efflux transporter DmeF n=1 Tax=Paradevosia shaoguanensis TaxID=1335043 RepID=A0AA41UAN6_9HYPH|nr:CDF family Co(II)/Ni(II) efflux transporter DmeF [Paradevosia shaoguanensis]MCF1742067.1 CDF family Co(II)/Ni(II) efflux transporter DmeF [Paradevosia shaoguanensis]MCI0126550.1 CDF family Co(II)/Ni(II) efflux transporter DmeF [Paradevosia shaoguanensis]